MQQAAINVDESAAESLPNTYERGASYPTFECAPPTDPEPVEIADGVEVVDAKVRCQYNSDPSLFIFAERRPTPEDSYPAPETESGDVWLTQTSGGVIYALQDSPAQPPADTSPRQPAHDVTHESLETQKRAKKYSHTTVSCYNRRDDLPGLATQQYIRDADDPSMGRAEEPIRVELARAVIARYINGPLGSDTNKKHVYLSVGHGKMNAAEPEVE